MNKKNTVSVNSRKWLLRPELEKILKSAKKRSHRDYSLILLSYRHGLRSGELLLLRYSNIDFKQNLIWIERLKGGISSNHVLAPDECKIIKKLQKQSDSDFIYRIKTPRIRQICAEIGKDTKIDFNHHRLRHTCGYDMAMSNIDVYKIKNFLGHSNINNTMIYVRGAGQEVKNLPKWHL